MKAAAAVMFAMTATGCYVHAVEDRSTTRRDEVQVTEDAPGRDRIELTVTQRELMVTLATAQQCLRQRFVLTETTTHRHAEVVEVTGEASDEGDGADRSIGLYNSALIYAFAAPVAIVLVAASAVATAVEVGLAHRRTTRERALVESVRFDCPAPLAGIAVTLTMPTGHVFQSATGIDGVATFALAADEEAGTLHVRAGALEATAVIPSRDADVSLAVATRRGMWRLGVADHHDQHATAEAR
jgi:hypothetical protein